MLYFQSPLRGKFEIVAKRSTYNDRDVEIAYGMQSVEPVKDKQAISINKLIHANNEVEKKLDVPNTGDLFEFRIEVDGSTVTTTINGVVVHKETYSAPPDPWIILQSKSPYAQGVIRDFRIVGNPEIPNEINLIDIGVWAGWRADHFEESYSTYSGTTTESDSFSFGNSSGRSSTSPWQLTGEEIVGTLRTNLGTQPRESLLMYQRPMLEDGEIEWESFHSTGEVEVHPAIGRVAFLIRSSGVQLHRLTDGSYETSDLTTDNAIPLEGASAVEIKEKDWNKFKLSLKGDRMILAVNAKEVAHFTVTEKTSQRYFGLFRYSNQTHSRVRNLIYRGGWPKVLPLVKDQELAYPMGGPIQLSSDTNIQTTTIILGPSLEAIQKQGLKLDGRADQFTPTDKGLKIEMRNASLNEDRPAIKLPLVLDKDCEITVEFEGLTVTSAEKGWGTIFSLVAYLNDAEQSEIECAATSASGERMLLSTTVRRLTPEGKYHKPESLQVSRTKPTGRMRLVRTGSEIHSLFADSGSEDFELIQSIPIGKSGIKSISIEAKSSDDAGKIDVTVKQITVRTQ